MKKLIVLLSLLVIALFVVSCAPKEAGEESAEEGALAGQAIKLTPIIKPKCSDLISPAGSFVLNLEYGKEQMMGSPQTILDELNENAESFNNACGGSYYLRSCSSLENLAAKYLNGEGKKGMPIVVVNIIHLTENDKSAVSNLLVELGYEKWEYSFFEGYDKNKPVWRWNQGLKNAWFSGDIFIDIIGPLALVDYSLVKSYYDKYPPTE